MTLYDYLKLNKEEEVTVTDKDYDTESYWYWCKPSDRDEWDKAVLEIAKHLKVTKINKWNVVCNLSDLIEKHIEAIEKADLFIDVNMDEIMYDIDNIIAGYVSEEWMKKFSEILCK